MSNYTKATNFTAKDTLPSGDSGKIIKGTEIDVELTAVASAISSKADTNSPTFTGTPLAPTAAAGTNTTQIATTAFATAAAVAAFPSGGIIMWSGSIASIPSGLYLCNGSNGTPDLRDRFVVGAGSSYSVDGTGGSTTTSAAGAHTHGGATGGHELTEAQMPKHFHRTWGPQTGYASVIPTTYGGNGNFPGGTPDDGAADYATWSTGGGTASGERVTGTGNGQSHSHTISSVSDHTHTITPPYYALAFIMKA